jgi:hypothetical protein
MTGLVPSGIDEIGLQPGSHVCAFYRGDTDRDRLLTGYLGAGLTAGDKCICVVDSANTAERLESLPGACGEPGPYTGQLDIHLPESTYLAGVHHERHAHVLDRGHGQGRRGVTPSHRLVGEMTWALRDARASSTWSATVRAEPGHRRYPVVMLCLYDLDRFRVVVNIVRPTRGTHPGPSSRARTTSGRTVPQVSRPGPGLPRSAST